MNIIVFNIGLTGYDCYDCIVELRLEKRGDIVKRILSAMLTLVMSLSLFMSFGTTASAALFTGTETGEMQDTSSEDNGIIYWELSYSLTTASLKISGDGYMPNGTDQCWKTALGNRDITELTIENGVKSIMEGAFYGEEKLTSVILPESLEFIGDSAFADTSITKVTLPANLNTFDGTIFNSQSFKEYNVHPDNQYFTAVDGVLYSKDMTELVAYPIGRFADGGKNDFLIPETVEKIGNYAFLNCKHTAFKIPGTVKNIGKQAFAGNTALSSLEIENGVESMYDGAFLACNSLTSIHLPTSVKYIGYSTLGFGYAFDFEGLSFMLDQQGIQYEAVTAENAVYYASLIGYSIDCFIICVVNESVKIYAPTNSAGHNYCKMFGVAYRSSEAITPKLISAEQTVSGVELHWSVSSDADGYYIYRKNKSGSYERIATVKGNQNTSYTDTKAFSSYKNTYTVKAYNTAGVSRYKVAGISVYYIPTPKLSSAKSHYNGVKVSWGKVSTATNYTVYRKSSEDEMWEPIADVKKSKLYYIDKDVTNLKNYQYTVRAYDAKSISDYNKTGVGTKYVAAPKITSFKNITKGVYISWKKVSGASSYRVYRKTGDGSWKLIKKLNSKTLKFTDENVKSGVKYSYAIKAVSSGTISGYYTKTTEFLKKPVVSSAKSTREGIVLKYSKSTGSDKYRIYRKASGEKDWTRIATVKGSSKVSYTDKTAKKGVTYRYTVRAFSGSYKSAYDKTGYKIKDKY